MCFPSVGVPQDERFVYISRALFIVYTILSCIGIGLAIVCLAMNLIFKERKYVKAGTPASLVPRALPKQHPLFVRTCIKSDVVIRILLYYMHSSVR